MSMRNALNDHDIYESLVHQANQGNWTLGFELRKESEDPWGLGIFEPNNISFAKTPEQHDKIIELRALIFDVVRHFFIADDAWQELEAALRQLYCDPALCSFIEQSRGNLFIVTPHVQFHDLGIVAAASMSVRAQLEKDNPFAAPDDPARDQTIVANRVLSLLDHADFRRLTGLPILEGLMLPISNVLTTLSANGTARFARRMLGRDSTSALNGLTRDRLVQMTTRGSQIIIMAPSGTQASRQKVDPFSEALVVPEASSGTKELIVELNKGEAITRRNAVAGLFIDCPSITPSGQIEAVDAGIGLCPDVWVPTEASQLELILKATIRTGVGHGRRGGLEFRYGSVDADPHLRRTQVATLEKIKLSEVV